MEQVLFKHLQALGKLKNTAIIYGDERGEEALRGYIYKYRIAFLRLLITPNLESEVKD